jgi:hypothetical protein
MKAAEMQSIDLLNNQLVVNMSDDQLFELVNSKGLSLEDTETLFDYVKYHGVDEFLFRIEFDNLMVVYPINGSNVELAFPLENVNIETL